MFVERLGDALSRPYHPIPEIIGSGVLPEECKAVVYGVFKAGKSTLLQNIGLSCAGGLPLFGCAHFPTKECRVLYVQLEMPHRAFIFGKGRLKDSQLSTIQKVRDNFYFTTEFWMKLDSSDGRDKLREMVELVSPSLVIIDPLYKTITGSENSAEDMGKATDTLDILMSQYHFALLFSAQGRKTQIIPKIGKVDLGDEELRGTTAIPGWVDSILGLRYAGENKRTLSFNLRHGDRERFIETVRYDKQTGLYSLV